MKKRLLLIAPLMGLCSAYAQVQGPSYYSDNGLSKWCADVNFSSGSMNQQISQGSVTGNYLNPVNAQAAKINTSAGTSKVMDFQLGHFWGGGQNFGWGTGLMYMNGSANLGLNNFHVEYQSQDAMGQVFRQSITAVSPISETIKASSFNIPMVLKYKTSNNHRVGFAMEAGLVYNIRLVNSYSTNAAFNYEAIYKQVTTADGNTMVYETSPVPNGTTDILYTKSQYLANFPNGNAVQYFDSLRKAGYNVAMNTSPNKKSGSLTLNGSLGFIVRPQISFHITGKILLNIGAYYIYQAYQNSSNTSFRLTDKVGSYASLVNGITSGVNSSYGASVGLRFLLGKHQYKGR